MTNIEAIADEWSKRDRYMGTGFACSHYARCARAAVQDGLDPAVALAAYDHATRYMHRWNGYHRPDFPEVTP